MKKSEYDSKGNAPSFESHLKEQKRNFKIASSLEMLQQVLTLIQMDSLI